MLHYVTNTSLDGYIEDASGDFGFAESTDEYFAFITDLIRPFTTYVYGRRLYEAMSVWETDASLAAMSDLYADFAATWQAADKVVYSTTLPQPITQHTRIERSFDPDAVRAITSSHEAMIGGALIADAAFAAELVDEVHLFVNPVSVGRGKAALPREQRVAFELVDERRFDHGAVYLRYRVR